MISFVLGMFRLGFIDVILSRALQRGFVTAVALVIMIEQVTHSTNMGKDVTGTKSRIIQLVPMLGLSRLQKELQPVTTVEKFFFLVEYAWTNTHVLTAAISLGCLSFLILTRMIKTRLRKHFPGIFYVPEVFLLVVFATGWSLRVPRVQGN